MGLKEVLDCFSRIGRERADLAIRNMEFFRESFAFR